MFEVILRDEGEKWALDHILCGMTQDAAPGSAYERDATPHIYGYNNLLKRAEEFSIAPFGRSQALDQAILDLGMKLI